MTYTDPDGYPPSAWDTSTDYGPPSWACDHHDCGARATTNLAAPRLDGSGRPSGWTAQTCEQHLDRYIAAGWLVQKSVAFMSSSRQDAPRSAPPRRNA